ncbi:TonB-dependent receptor [Solimonas marina]|uniref:TonB-dependent receptor n=1 Tax=Solimonas marina TaxID=2714601 RepID=A0A969WF75_9GAMM|nr:TonB-dependent receptor [Solimonas marina]NKF24211.1 TonB-dependent receptor [Solimonas marina]
MAVVSLAAAEPSAAQDSTLAREHRDQQTVTAAATTPACTNIAADGTDCTTGKPAGNATAASPAAVDNTDGSDSGNDAIAEIVVTGIRNSLTKALEIKRDNKQIVDAIVAEDIGKFPDNNVVEALQRVTGVQTTNRAGGEVSAVTIRGLGDVNTTVNGREIFTSTGRSVALADIPASLLAGVNVYKTRSASQIEGGIAGAIDVRTFRPFDFDGFKLGLAARGIYATNTERTDPNVSVLLSDRWKTDYGDFGALLNIGYAKTRFRDESIWNGSADPYYANNYERIPEYGSDGELAVDRGTPISTAAGSTLRVNGADREYVLLRDAMGGWNRFGERTRPAANVSLQWAPTQRSEYYLEAFYDGYRNTDSNSLLFAFVNNNDHYQDPVLFPGTNVVKENYVNNPYIFTSTQAQTGQTDSYQYALGGKWDLSDTFTLKSEAVYQTSTYHWFNQIQDMGSVRPQLAVDFNHNNSGTPALVFPDDPSTSVNESDLTNPDGWNLAWYYDQKGRDSGDAWTWSTDGDWYIEDSFFQKLQFGLRLDRRTATSGAGDRSADCAAVAVCASQIAVSDHPDLYRSSPGSYFHGQAIFPRKWIIAGYDYLLSHTAESRARYGFDTGSPAMDPSRYFDIDENTYAGYLQTDFERQTRIGDFDGQVGVRVVHAETDLGYNELVDTNTWGPSGQTKSRTDVLPNGVIRFHPTDKLMARLAYGQTISRPSFAQLNPAMVLTPPSSTAATFGYATSGNPDLKPTKAKTVDLSLEYYFAQSSSVYAVLFWRNVDGFIYSVDRSIQVTDRSDTLNGNYVLTSPQNAGKGKLNGVEIGFQWFPDQVPGWLHGIGLLGSYTSIDGNTKDPVYDETDTTDRIGTETNPLVGVSKWSYSAVLAYERGPVSARLSYVDRSKFLTGYNYCCSMPTQVYSEGEASMDLSIGYKATDKLTLTVDATNLTGEIYHDYYGDPTLFNLGTYHYSRTYALGLRYQL